MKKTETCLISTYFVVTLSSLILFGVTLNTITQMKDLASAGQRSDVNKTQGIVNAEKQTEHDAKEKLESQAAAILTLNSTVERLKKLLKTQHDAIEKIKSQAAAISTLNSTVERLEKLHETPCPQTKFKFRGGKVTDWVRVKTPIQEITSATFCSWITPLAGTEIQGSYISYSTFSEDNEFLVYFYDGKITVIYFDHDGQEKPFTMTSKAHLCITIAPTFGWANVFTNGRFRLGMNFTASRRSIEGGGNLLLGQEQDSFMGGFKANQAFSGTIENLMMWYRILDDAEILSLYNNSCSCPVDYAIAFTPDQIQLEGKVASLPVDEC